MSLRKKLKLNSVENPECEQVDPDAESEYFKNNNIAQELLKIESTLVMKLKGISLSSVECIYSPLEYAYQTHSMYVHKYCNNKKKILFLGLNPGPWGMAQTGVPFGEVNITRDWLKIEGPVQKPSNELSARPVKGFDCHRSEVSGKKIWSFFQNLCATPENFFKYSYMHNYCPLLLMKNSGSNITPADLPKNSVSADLLKHCDETLSEVLKLLQVEIVVGVGRFAQKRAKETVEAYKLNNIRVFFMVHPSPRIPRNENWHEKAKQTLEELDLLQYFVQ